MENTLKHGLKPAVWGDSDGAGGRLFRCGRRRVLLGSGAWVFGVWTDLIRGANKPDASDSIKPIPMSYPSFGRREQSIIQIRSHGAAGIGRIVLENGLRKRIERFTKRCGLKVRRCDILSRPNCLRGWKPHLRKSLAKWLQYFENRSSRYRDALLRVHGRAEARPSQSAIPCSKFALKKSASSWWRLPGPTHGSSTEATGSYGQGVSDGQIVHSSIRRQVST